MSKNMLFLKFRNKLWLVIAIIIFVISTLIFTQYKNINTDNKSQASSSISSSSSSTSSQSSSVTAKKIVIPSTAQISCYNNTNLIICPSESAEFFEQDAQQPNTSLKYKDNGDGTITDEISGLTWIKSMGQKMSYADALANATSVNTAGYTDWRLPSIKELYSLINFQGHFNISATKSVPFIDTKYFDFQYDTSGENIGSDDRTDKGTDRWIDVQNWSATKYVGTTMGGDQTVFGVNFADGRIKGYPQFEPGSNNTIPRTMYVRYVRGNTNYGKNMFSKSESGLSVIDKWSGLTWQQTDDGKTRNWQQSLSYCKDLSLDGYTDWRLPNVKELQSIVDYTKSPQIQQKGSIDEVFNLTNQQSYFWSSTTILDGPDDVAGDKAVYIAFGEAKGYVSMPPDSPNKVLVDVHGAGAQRADPKDGNPAEFSQGFGPQGDDIRIYNYVRCVRVA